VALARERVRDGSSRAVNRPAASAAAAAGGAAAAPTQTERFIDSSSSRRRRRWAATVNHARPHAAAPPPPAAVASPAAAPRLRVCPAQRIYINLRRVISRYYRRLGCRRETESSHPSTHPRPTHLGAAAADVSVVPHHRSA